MQQTQITEFYPLEHTVSAMLDVFSTCLQLEFISVSPELFTESIYRKDVKLWSVWDRRVLSKGAFMGYLYTDLFWRPGKHAGLMNVNLQCGYLKDDGSRVYPATILHCAFPRPTSTGFALLKQLELVSLFHELGHGIHDLVSRTSIARFHGHHTAPDFFEIPSVMLENWCWMTNELEQMSCHYSTLQPEFLEQWRKDHPGQADPPREIPGDMLDGLVQSRNAQRALWLLRQL